jgi:Na+/H+-dicarboxylate symporter
VGYIPTNVLTPFVDNAVLSIIILALLFGFALRA